MQQNLLKVKVTLNVLKYIVIQKFHSQDISYYLTPFKVCAPLIFVPLRLLFVLATEHALSGKFFKIWGQILFPGSLHYAIL